MNGPASPRRKAVFDPMALDDLDATLAPPEPAPTPTNSRSEGDQATEVDTPEPASTGPAPVNPPSDAGPASARCAGRPVGGHAHQRPAEPAPLPP